MTLRFPPGPSDYCFGMRTMSRMKADVLGVYTELQRDFGDAVSFRTGPYRLFLFYHPDQVREVLVSHAKSMIRLPLWIGCGTTWLDILTWRGGAVRKLGKYWVTGRPARQTSSGLFF